MTVEPASSTPNDETTVDFLAHLYEGFEEGFVTLFAAHPDRKNTPPDTRWAPASQASDLANDAAALHGWNVWFGCATRREQLDGGKRGGKDDCVAIPGLWVDIDIAGPGHATTATLPTEDQAYKLINDFPLPPTVIINSGHGLQPWWALQEPHTLAESDLLARWGATWARRAIEAGGFHLDNVYDDPRIMRLPGTINTKTGCPPVPVTIEVDDWRNRYGADDIERHLDAAPPQPAANNSGIPYIGPERPGDAYNTRHTTSELLIKLGFIPGRVDRDGSQHWKWPAAIGDQSATTYPDGHCAIWSETAAQQLGVKTQTSYTPFGLYTDLNHRGDYTTAARQLAQEGYGTPPVQLADLISTPDNNTTTDTPAAAPIDQALIDGIRDDYGITGPDAWKLAEQIGTRITHERTVEYARKLIRDERLIREADLNTIRSVSVAELLAQERPERTPLFGQLLAQGHNATIVARWKVGKSTFVDNAAIAASTGGSFLGHFPVPEPLRVVIFNYELHDDDMQDRLFGYAIPHSARENIHVVNLRGRRLPIGTIQGRDIAVRLLTDHAAQLWIVDPFGAAYAAAGGEDENNNAEVRRFLIALDEIKRLAECPSMLMPVHTGRRVDQEGDEQGRGATVLEDWPDVRMLLTRGQKEQRDDRFLRTEGRAWELDESRLTFNPLTKELGLPEADMGVSRRKAKTFKNARIIADAVEETPGIIRNALFEAIADLGITANAEKQTALEHARESQLVHWHPGKKNAQHHYIGGHHPDAEPCPGGWKNHE